MPEPRQREDEATRPNEVPNERTSEGSMPERDPTGLPTNDGKSKPVSEVVLDVDDAQLIDPSAEPGKPI